MDLPSGFSQMALGLLGKEEGEAFLKAMQEPPAVSVRLNSRKPSGAFQDEDRVPWCPQGRYLDRRPVFTLDPLLHAGAYYVQDASSMIHGEAVARLTAIWEKEGHEPGSWPLSLLDMCAAPGGKTTAMIDRLPDNTRVTANEYVAKRAVALRENLTKWGFPATVTNRDSRWFADRGMLFDIIAVDAPCSGEGMMRKEEKAIAQWCPELVEDCARLQKEILSNASAALRPGGFLIYSTCTFNRTENEENLDYAVRDLGLEAVELDFPQEWGIPRGIDTALSAWRFMPHKTRGEGLFLCVLRKPGVFDPPRLKEVRLTAPSLKPGATPDIGEILCAGSGGAGLPVVSVDKDKALAYLRREAIVLGPEVPKGPVAIAFEGLPLGPAKNIGSRANNLYPKEWRILMR